MGIYDDIFVWGFAFNANNSISHSISLSLPISLYLHVIAVFAAGFAIANSTICA